MTSKIPSILALLLLLWSCNSSHNDPGGNLSPPQLDSLKKVECERLLYQLHQTGADTFGEIKSIPKDFEGCIRQLDSVTNEGMKAWIRCLPDGRFGSRLHLGFGMYLRNSWGLWAGSPLAVNLSEMGMLHPDDMTGIVFTTYQRLLKGEDPKLEAQIQNYQDYWRQAGMPVDSILESINSRKK